jgi:hypothetical protein
MYYHKRAWNLLQALFALLLLFKNLGIIYHEVKDDYYDENKKNAIDIA